MQALWFQVSVHVLINVSQSVGSVSVGGRGGGGERERVLNLHVNLLENFNSH